MAMKVRRWAACGALMSAVSYLVSLQGAAYREQLQSVSRAVLRSASEIRLLEAEFATRSSIAQLERWSRETLALSTPRADQFVADTALASLGSPLPEPRPVQVAVLTSLPGDVLRPLGQRRPGP